MNELRERAGVCLAMYETALFEVRVHERVLRLAEDEMLPRVGCATSDDRAWQVEEDQRRAWVRAAALRVFERFEWWLSRAEFWGREYARAADGVTSDFDVAEAAQ